MTNCCTDSLNIFDHLQNQHHLTDRQKFYHGWLCWRPTLLCKICCGWVASGQNNYRAGRLVGWFSHLMGQMTWTHSRMRLFWDFVDLAPIYGSNFCIQTCVEFGQCSCSSWLIYNGCWFHWQSPGIWLSLCKVVSVLMLLAGCPVCNRTHSSATTNVCQTWVAVEVSWLTCTWGSAWYLFCCHKNAQSTHVCLSWYHVGWFWWQKLSLFVFFSPVTRQPFPSVCSCAWKFLCSSAAG